MIQRAQNILNRPGFKTFCYTEKQKPGFSLGLQMAEKLAFLDGDMPVNKNALVVPFDQQFFETLTFEFYEWLDAIYPTNPLTDTVKENFNNYLTYTFTPKYPGEQPRPGCGSTVHPNGTVDRSIFIDPTNDIRTYKSGPHEAGHSLSKTFTLLNRRQHEDCGEVAPVIIDKLFMIFLKEKHPDLYNQVAADLEIADRNLMVIKARECLLDASILKVACGEQTMNDVIKNYGKYFTQGMINSTFTKIENYKFMPMYENRYMLQSMLAYKMVERFEADRYTTVKQLKHILQNDDHYSFQDVLDYLNMPTKQQLIDDYIASHTAFAASVKTNVATTQQGLTTQNNTGKQQP